MIKKNDKLITHNNHMTAICNQSTDYISEQTPT